MFRRWIAGLHGSEDVSWTGKRKAATEQIFAIVTAP